MMKSCPIGRLSGQFNCIGQALLYLIVFKVILFLISSCKKKKMKIIIRERARRGKESDKIRSENIARHSEVVTSSSGETHGESECSR